MKNLRVSEEPNASSPPQPRMSDELPLDINFNSAIDWLTQRRVVPAAWQKAMRAVQARRAAAIEADRGDLPAATVALLRGDPATFWDCERVLASLVGAAGFADKSFLGAYVNAHTARWADVVKRYERDGIFLADAASYMQHQVGYELPALKVMRARPRRRTRCHAEWLSARRARWRVPRRS